MNNATNNNAIILIRRTAKFQMYTYDGDGVEYRKKIQSDDNGEFIMVNGLEYRLEQDEQEEPDTVATMPELVEPPKPIPVFDDAEEIDALVQEYTAFDSLDEMCDQQNYFPSLNVSNPHCEKIANAYDNTMRWRGDTRRAFRYSDDDDNNGDTIIVTLNQAMFHQMIHNMNDALETMGAESRVRTLSDVEKRTHRTDANLMVMVKNETHAVNNFGDAMTIIFETEILQLQRLDEKQHAFIQPYILHAKAATNSEEAT